jgi:hypothetical protein
MISFIKDWFKRENAEPYGDPIREINAVIARAMLDEPNDQEFLTNFEQVLKYDHLLGSITSEETVEASIRYRSIEDRREVDKLKKLLAKVLPELKQEGVI